MVNKHVPNRGYAPNKDAVIKPRPTWIARDMYTTWTWTILVRRPSAPHPVGKLEGEKRKEGLVNERAYYFVQLHCNVIET